MSNRFMTSSVLKQQLWRMLFEHGWCLSLGFVSWKQDLQMKGQDQDLLYVLAVTYRKQDQNFTSTTDQPSFIACFLDIFHGFLKCSVTSLLRMAADFYSFDVFHNLNSVWNREGFTCKDLVRIKLMSQPNHTNIQICGAVRDSKPIWTMFGLWNTLIFREKS
jgi:hypothetical protein